MPQPLFVLCPPRSYSSVVCGIIGQHPDCYGLPELNLFLGDTLGEGWHKYPVVKLFMGRHGLLRTLAQLHEGEQTPDTVTRAEEWVTQHFDWPVRKVFDHLQEQVGDRILVEKSPMFTGEQGYMERMLQVFPQASILHLIRHPRGMGKSFITLRSEYDVLRHVVAADPEQAWQATHELIIAMTENLPLGQCMRLKGEALLANLETYLPQICEWLDIRTDAKAIDAMMHPEHSPYACLGPPGAPRGNDPNFLSNPAIDRARLAKLQEPSLDGELSWRSGEVFTPETRKLAKQLGYH